MKPKIGSSDDVVDIFCVIHLYCIPCCVSCMYEFDVSINCVFVASFIMTGVYSALLYTGVCYSKL